jgi:predicted RNA-binding protein with PIN domain
MGLLIDGYNLLHVTGIFGRGIGPGTLERSRRALLNFLVATIPEEELSRTTVVFDAKDAPPGLPRRVQHRGITVRFARSHDEADDLIEELIRKDSAPRRLTVVSSDHRLHRAARRRRATAVDSDVWYESVRRQGARQHETSGVEYDLKPEAPLSAEDISRWLEAFGATDDASSRDRT